MIFETRQGFTLLVDKEDFDYLSQFNWSRNNSKPYFYGRSGEVRGKRLHRVVAARAGLDIVGFQVDHVNRDPYDNRRKNLRVATHGQNRANSELNCNNTSGFKGVSLKRGRWYAQINANGKKISLGYFDTPEEAHEAYKQAAQQHFGSFSNY